MIICTSCGRALQSGAKVCQGCGAKVEESAIAQSTTPSSNKSVTPPPIKVPKAPIPSRQAVVEEVKVTPRQELPKKSGFPIGKVFIFLIAIVAASFWFWQVKQAEEQKAIEQARIAEEQRVEAEKLVKERERLAKEAQIKAEQEKEALRLQAEELRAQKEAALEAKRKAEEDRKALEQAQLDNARKMQEQAKAAELEKAKLARERQLSLDRNRNNNFQAQSVQPNQQQVAPPANNVKPQDQQQVADGGNHTAYFRGAFNMLIMKKHYPTEEMKNQALEIWKTKREILELDGTTSKPPNQGNNTNTFLHN